MRDVVARVADWRAVRTGVVTAALVAVLAALGGLALAASGTAWRVAGTLAIATALGGALLLVMRRLNRLDASAQGTHLLAHRVAELEAREILREYCGAPHDALKLDAQNVWGEALRVFIAAIMSGWRLLPKDAEKSLPGIQFYPPPNLKTNAVFLLLTPLDLERVDTLSSWLRGHGVHLQSVSGSELPPY